MCDYKITYDLKQQTPLIHFQHYENGACLRPSEVKPKLDRFLFALHDGLEKLKKQHPDWFMGYNPDAKDDEDKVKNIKDALNYKMQIISTDKVKPNPNIHKLYFGNMGKKPHEKICSLFSDKGFKLTIICFNIELLKEINDYLIDFFLVTNFGTRQNKGFGSFRISAINGEKCSYTKSIIERISKYYTHFFYMEYEQSASNYIVNDQKKRYGYETMFDDICEFYSLLKSGINFGREYHKAYIYRYAYSKGIGNEKRWMKDENISPSLVTKNLRFSHKINEYENNPKYVRAMLGIPEKLEYSCATKLNKSGKEVADPAHKVIVTVSDTEDEIKRCPSPILFKIVDKYIVILYNELPEEMYDRSFCFDGNTMRSGTLSTPPKCSGFSIAELLDHYCIHLEKIRKCSEQTDNRQQKFKIDEFKERYYSYSLPEIIKKEGDTNDKRN